MADLETSTPTPRREAAQNASKIISEQLDSDSQTSGPVAEHAESSAENHRPRKRVKSGKGHKSRKATTTKPAASSPRSSPSLAQPDESGLPPTNATSNDASADLDINHIGIDGLSDLTSLSSDEEQSSPDIDVAVSSRRAVLPKPFPLSMVEHSSPIPEASTSRVSRPKVPKASSGSGPGRPRSSFKPSDFDTYVWVLIAPDTGCLYDRETAQDKGLWWPGKIQNPHTTNEPIEVKLYGKGSLSILSPAGNLIPQTTRGTKLKFMKPSYQHPSNGPRKKKQKREQDNMQGIWQAAVDEMKSDMNLTTIKADAIDVLDLTGTTDDEELPLYVKPNPSSSSKLSSVPSTAPHPQGTTGIRNHGKKRKRVNMDSDDSLSDASDSVFFRKEDGDGGEADISLQIPGELVIGRSKNQLNVYWPAKIEAYVPPTKSGLSGKYHVIFLDGTREDIPREWFYTMAEPGFAQCKLGHFESKDPNLVADDDDEEDVEEDRTSPVPQDPPPLKEDFLDLPIAQQFIYTKDILRAILNDKYAPSRQKHDYFIRGGRYRKHVTDQALLRGMMSARDVERLHKIVLAWCLKNLPEDDDPPETDAVEDLQKSLQDIGSASVIPSEPVPDEPSTLEDIVMEEPSIANDSPEQAVPEGPVLAELAPATRLTDYIHPESAIRFTSPSPTDKLVSSPPPEMPPSSNPLSAFEYTSSQSDIFQTHNLEAVSSPPASSFVPSVIADEALSIHNDTERDLSDLTPVEEEDEVNVTKRVFVPFKSLGPLVQVEYCSNVLVPEAIRQILLWRTGERTQTGLLSPEQEQSLYEKGQKLLVERDWVFDVVRLREKQVQNLKVESEKLERRWLKKNGGLSRPRRNVGTRKYAE